MSLLFEVKNNNNTGVLYFFGINTNKSNNVPLELQHSLGQVWGCQLRQNLIGLFATQQAQCGACEKDGARDSSKKSIPNGGVLYWSCLNAFVIAFMQQYLNICTAKSKMRLQKFPPLCLSVNLLRNIV